MFLSLFAIVLLFSQNVLCSPLPDDAPSETKFDSNEKKDRFKDWDKDIRINPEEFGEHHQGDILLDQRKGITTFDAVKDSKYRWPSARIPYVIEGQFSTAQRNLIFQAMNVYHNKTCIRFVQKTSKDKDYVAITSNKAGCNSFVGRIGGRQQLNLETPGCTNVLRTSLHELMHAIGFNHEHTRPNRDSYVTIHLENVPSKQQYNFNKDDPNSVENFGVSYDYGSVMHYSDRAFSKNGNVTIVPKDPKAASYMGKRDVLSEKDLQRLRIMYNCPK